MTSPLATVRSWRYGSAILGRDTMPLHGDCSAPIDHMVRGRGSDLLVALDDLRKQDWDFAPGYGWVPGTFRRSPVPTDTAYVRVRCRKCPECLWHRRRLWTARAITELRLSPRTWFGTLTFRPMDRFRMVMKADQLSRQRRAERLDGLDDETKFQLTAQQTGREVTLFMKRLRKGAAGPLRYLLVTEAHKDGFPHYHLLLHETVASAVSKRQLEAQWLRGFSHWRLIDAHDPKATGYACKYLSKTASTRVRASQQYGKGAQVARRLSAVLTEANIAISDIWKEKGVCQERVPLAKR